MYVYKNNDMYLYLDYVLLYREYHHAYKHFLFHLGMKEGGQKLQTYSLAPKFNENLQSKVFNCIERGNTATAVFLALLHHCVGYS